LSSHDVAQTLKRRGEEFLRSAKYNMSVGAFDLAVFDAHQAAELYLKGVLLSLLGTYPRTHDLTELVEDWLAETCGEAVAEFLAEWGERLDHLTDAYFSSRYAVRTFKRRHAEVFIRTAEEVIELAKGCEGKAPEG